MDGSGSGRCDEHMLKSAEEKEMKERLKHETLFQFFF